MEYQPCKTPQIPSYAGSSHHIRSTATEPRQQNPGEKALRTHLCASAFTGTKRSTHCACLSDTHNSFQEPFKDILKTLSLRFHGNNFLWCVEPNEAQLHWHTPCLIALLWMPHCPAWWEGLPLCPMDRCSVGSSSLPSRAMFTAIRACSWGQ